MSNDLDIDVHWESAQKFIERQTVEIMREFKTSRPRPRNKRMGFRDEPRRRRSWLMDSELERLKI